MNTPTLSCPLEIQLLLDAYCYPKPLGNGSPAAEKAIRKLTELGAIQPQQGGEPGRYDTTELGRRWLAALESVPCPSVPEIVLLGENVTRDGRRARVICNDAEGPEPVVALVQLELGRRDEVLVRFQSNGLYRPGERNTLDLVGLKHHEIQPPAEVSELEDLRRWKAEAMEVCDSIPFQEIGEEMGLKIGDDVGPKILPYIRSLKSRMTKLASYANAITALINRPIAP